MTQVHGGKLVAQALKRHGVTHVFTLCGGHIQAIYDGCLDEGIRVVDVRHEQTAGHAADGYARVTGRPGVCLVTAGPGITNAVTAVASAQRAGVPMLCIGGAGPKALCDMGSLQDMNSVTLMRPLCKWSVQVPEARRLKEYIDSAFPIAQAGDPEAERRLLLRAPGPVHIADHELRGVRLPERRLDGFEPHVLHAERGEAPPQGTEGTGRGRCLPRRVRARRRAASVPAACAGRSSR